MLIKFLEISLKIILSYWEVFSSMALTRKILDTRKILEFAVSKAEDMGENEEVSDCCPEDKK